VGRKATGPAGIAGLPKQEEFCKARGLNVTWAFLLEIEFQWNAGESMSVFKKCPFYRGSESISMGKGLGRCDVDASQTICDGDVKFCEEPNTVEQYILVRLEKNLQEVEERA